jgi:hypothetical protein
MAKVSLLTKIGLGLLGVLAVFSVVVATRPSHFHVERSQAIPAPPAAVFSLIDDFHRWPEWSPWEKLDPAMKREYSGPASGVGASYEWTGNEDVGRGSMRITESQAPSRVAIALEFKEPWQATNTTLFSIAPAPSGATVTWGMDGESNFVFKAMSLFMDMDSMVGKDFEEGLSNLARLAQASQARRPDSVSP